MKGVALVVLLLAVTMAEYTEEDDVVVLTVENFAQALDEFPNVLVEFYAPWCGHCKKLAPEYSKAAKELKPKGVVLAKVDVTTNDELGTLYDIKGFPTIKFFQRGAEPVAYEGPRQAADIVSYLLKKTGPASAEVNFEQLKTLVENVKDTPVSVYFGQSSDEQTFVDYESVAKGFERITFVHTFAPEAREHYRVADDVKVVLFKGFDNKRDDYTQGFDTLGLTQFLSVNSVPTVLPFDEKAIQTIFQAGSPALFLFANENDESVAAFEEFSAVAAQFKDKVKFSFSKPNDGSGYFSRLAEYVGADQNKLPNLMLVDPANENAKYKFEHEITRENIQTFVSAFISKTLVRYLKSHDVPETNDEPVKVVVGKNFQDLVVNNDKDVLVEFYAPWCGHCKQLVPIYDELARKLAVNPNIVIAKCDSTGNEIPGVEIQSFPTIKFFKNGDKTNPIAYSGDRDVNGFLKFLKEQSSHPWVSIESHEDL